MAQNGSKWLKTAQKLLEYSGSSGGGGGSGGYCAGGTQPNC